MSEIKILCWSKSAHVTNTWCMNTWCCSGPVNVSNFEVELQTLSKFVIIWSSWFSMSSMSLVISDVTPLWLGSLVVSTARALAVDSTLLASLLTTLPWSLEPACVAALRFEVRVDISDWDASWVWWDVVCKVGKSNR